LAAVQITLPIPRWMRQGLQNLDAASDMKPRYPALNDVFFDGALDHALRYLAPRERRDFLRLATEDRSPPHPYCDTSLAGASSRWMNNELVQSVVAYLAEHDPDVLAAVEDVDRSLIQAEMQRSPIERLVASAQQARFYERLAASRHAAQGRRQ
jgi:hypothetical protein